jgi:hypothetical protein
MSVLKEQAVYGHACISSDNDPVFDGIKTEQSTGAALSLFQPGFLFFLVDY